MDNLYTSQEEGNPVGLALTGTNCIYQEHPDIKSKAAANEGQDREH